MSSRAIGAVTLALTAARCLAGEAGAGPVPSGAPAADELLDFAKRIEDTINGLDPSLFDASFDMDAVLLEAAKGVPISERALANVRRGWLARAKQGGLGTALCTGVAEGAGSFRLLRIRTVDGRPRALFRLAGDDGLNYHELILGRGGEAGGRIVDWYNFLAGELTSETWRRILVGVPNHTKPIPREDLPQSTRDLIWKMAVMDTAWGLARKGEPREALAAFDALPPRLRSDKLMIMQKLYIAKDAGEEQYAEAIALVEKHHPGDPALALLSIDGLLMGKEYGKALQAVDRLDEMVGGDPYLDVVRAGIHIESGDAERAETSALSAVNREPSLEQVHWALVSARMAGKDFVGVAEALETIEGEFGLDLGGLQEDETCREFAGSKEYRDWMERRKKKDEKTGAGGQEETGSVLDEVDEARKEIEEGAP